MTYNIEWRPLHKQINLRTRLLEKCVYHHNVYIYRWIIYQYISYHNHPIFLQLQIRRQCLSYSSKHSICCYIFDRNSCKIRYRRFGICCTNSKLIKSVLIHRAVARSKKSGGAISKKCTYVTKGRHHGRQRGVFSVFIL